MAVVDSRVGKCTYCGEMHALAAALTGHIQSLHELKVFLAFLVDKRSCSNAHTPCSDQRIVY